MWVAFANAKATHIFQQKFYDQSFNDMLTNYIFSFEQLGPDKYLSTAKQKESESTTCPFINMGQLTTL